MSSIAWRVTYLNTDLNLFSTKNLMPKIYKLLALKSPKK